VSDRVRLVTLYLLTRLSADGPARHEVVKQVLPGLQADVVALQEVTRNGSIDQAVDLLGADFTIVDLPGGDPTYGGECLAVRWPIARVDVLDQPLHLEITQPSPRAVAVAVEIVGPASIGALLVVHHKGTYELHGEHIREQQALATARFVEDLLRDRADLPAVLLGDFNAAPDTASIRFLTDRQSLHGYSVRYEDAWQAIHREEPGHTYEPRNPLVRAGQMPLERGRRIDYILTHSGAHGPLLEVSDCRLIFDEPVNGVWASDHLLVTICDRVDSVAPRRLHARDPPIGAASQLLLAGRRSPK
jgi:endonuclease/exonuclease/phosphatase family metal-dependent hydrolase